jgi:hypothetical protein
MSSILEQEPPEDNLGTLLRPPSWTRDREQVEKEFWELATDEPEYVLDVDVAAEFILNFSIDPAASVYLFGMSGSD